MTREAQGKTLYMRTHRNKPTRNVHTITRGAKTGEKPRINKTKKVSITNLKIKESNAQNEGNKRYYRMRRHERCQKFK